MFKKIRIAILLLILASVIQQHFAEKAALNWKHNFYVAVYPINADASPETASYIKTLTREDFAPLVEYYAEQGKRYQVDLRHPIEVQLGDAVRKMPPPPPTDGSVLSTILWSLNFRWFAWQNSPEVRIKPEIRLYLLYFNPAKHKRLSHSTALNKGRIGIVNLFADARYTQQNLVIVAHELLHTLNATDKYDFSTNYPIYPEGFAAPEQTPRYPQTQAEIMGGRVPIDAVKAEIPHTLAQTVIGEKTAHEIGWLK